MNDETERSEPADFGGGGSTGVQDLVDFEDSDDSDDTDESTGPIPLEDVFGESNHNLNESVDKIRLKTQIKRGSDTRDQDTHDINVRGETPSEAAENLSAVIEELEERNVFERVRSLQPDTKEEGK